MKKIILASVAIMLMAGNATAQQDNKVKVTRLNAESVQQATPAKTCKMGEECKAGEACKNGGTNKKAQFEQVAPAKANKEQQKARKLVKVRDGKSLKLKNAKARPDEVQKKIPIK